MDKKSDRVALFISVLLHSLLVFFPREETPRPSTVSSTPTTSISVVDASQLPAPPASESQPLPAILPSTPPPAILPSTPPPAVPPSTPPPAVPPSTPPPAVPPSTPPPSVPPSTPPPAVPPNTPPPSVPPSTPPPAVPPSPPVATVDPDADLPPEEPSTETSDRPVVQPAPDADPDIDLPPEEPSTETSDRPVDKAKIAADWEYLVGHLKGQDEGFGQTSLLEIFNLFGESEEQVHQFFDENGQPKLDVSAFYLFPTQTPEQVLQTVVMPELTSNTGFELQLQENISAGRAYQLLQGEMLRYLIIVQLNDRSGSVLMLSDSLLGLES